jgi:hypothetical protein
MPTDPGPIRRASRRGAAWFSGARCGAGAFMSFIWFLLPSHSDSLCSEIHLLSIGLIRHRFRCMMSIIEYVLRR